MLLMIASTYQLSVFCCVWCADQINTRVVSPLCLQQVTHPVQCRYPFGLLWQHGLRAAGPAICAARAAAACSMDKHHLAMTLPNWQV